MKVSPKNVHAFSFIKNFGWTDIVKYRISRAKKEVEMYWNTGIVVALYLFSLEQTLRI